VYAGELRGGEHVAEVARVAGRRIAFGLCGNGASNFLGNEIFTWL
jgi:hypothetical protein